MKNTIGVECQLIVIVIQACNFPEMVSYNLLVFHSDF